MCCGNDDDPRTTPDNPSLSSGLASIFALAADDGVIHGDYSGGWCSHSLGSHSHPNHSIGVAALANRRPGFVDDHDCGCGWRSGKFANRLGQDWKLAPGFPWWVVNRLSYLVGSTNLATFLIYYLQERFAELQGERAAAPAASIVMMVGIFVLLSTLPSGWLSDRFGKHPILLVAGSVAALGAGIVVLAPDLTLLRVAGAILGAATGLFYAANWALGTEVVPEKQAGRFLGLSNLAGAGAGAIGLTLEGRLRMLWVTPR